MSLFDATAVLIALGKLGVDSGALAHGILGEVPWGSRRLFPACVARVLRGAF